jgi:predicted N-acetyltransferase YhbS
MTLDRLAFRRGTPDDAPALARAVADAFEGYRAWAAPEWEPPDAASAAEVASLRERLADAGDWSLLALDGGVLAGHVMFEPARAFRGSPDIVPGLAHVAHVFVDERWWGTGLAARLLGEAVDEIRAQGYRAARLWTPAGQRRARAFYRREGWTETGQETFDEGLGLLIVELRIELAGTKTAEDAASAPADR